MNKLQLLIDKIKKLFCRHDARTTKFYAKTNFYYEYDYFLAITTCDKCHKSVPPTDPWDIQKTLISLHTKQKPPEGYEFYRDIRRAHDKTYGNPLFEYLRGKAPAITGGLPSEDFVAKSREEW